MSTSQDLRTPAYQVLADDIRAQITSGRLRPGDRLPTEPQLSVRAGLSRSTVREALRLLASQHLIVTMRGVAGGSFVAQPSADKLAESLSTGVSMLMNTAAVTMDHFLEVRELLEVPAAALAAERRTAADLSAMERAIRDPRTESVDTLLAAHRDFHVAVAASSRNPLFQVMTRPLYSVANERQLVAMAGADLSVRMMADHRAILAAIVDCDGAGAARAARTHLAGLRQIFSPEPAVDRQHPG